LQRAASHILRISPIKLRALSLFVLPVMAAGLLPSYISVVVGDANAHVPPLSINIDLCVGRAHLNASSSVTIGLDVGGGHIDDGLVISVLDIVA
jgi:hypothetical protein